ncbi:MAG: DUF3109 family protein [Gemmataceae bacterium]
MRPLTVVNAATATFECTFGRGCDGLCCRNGEPSVTAAERARIDAVLPRLLPHLRPEARQAVEAGGWLGDGQKLGLPMARVVDDWCVFFNQGCVLHKLGAADGDFARYKPIQCVLFPLEPNGDGTWYVRQRGYDGEEWDDLFCLNPANTEVKAVDALAAELAVAADLGPAFTWGEAGTRVPVAPAATGG